MALLFLLELHEDETLQPLPPVSCVINNNASIVTALLNLLHLKGVSPGVLMRYFETVEVLELDRSRMMLTCGTSLGQ